MITNYAVGEEHKQRLFFRSFTSPFQSLTDDCCCYSLVYRTDNSCKDLIDSLLTQHICLACMQVCTHRDLPRPSGMACMHATCITVRRAKTAPFCNFTLIKAHYRISGFLLSKPCHWWVETFQNGWKLIVRIPWPTNTCTLWYLRRIPRTSTASMASMV